MMPATIVISGQFPCRVLFLLTVFPIFLMFSRNDGPHFRSRRPFFHRGLIFLDQGDAVQFQKVAVVANKAFDEYGTGNGIIFIGFQSFQVFPLYIEGLRYVL